MTMTGAGRDRSRRGGRESGVSLIEVMIAVMILGMIIAALSPTLGDVSKSTGDSMLEVTASGIARQQLSYYQQQLSADTGYTGNVDGPYPWPFIPLLKVGTSYQQCYATGTVLTVDAAHSGNGTIVTYADQGLTVAVCQQGGTGTSAPATEVSYCTSLTPGSANCQLTTPTGFYYTATTTAEWVCQPGQFTKDGNAEPGFQVQVTVSWPAMGSTQTTSSQIVLAPPQGMDFSSSPPPDPLQSPYTPNTGGTPQCTT